MKIDGAYVLGLPRMGRLEEFYRSFPAGWPYPVPKLFHGPDVQHVPIPAYWKDLPAMAMCNLGHMGMIGLALSQGCDIAMFFEDDARWVPDPLPTLEAAMAELPADWDGLMIGGQISVFDGKTEPVSEHLSRCIQVERNHAYILSRKGMQTFYAALAEPTTIPIDHCWGELQEKGVVNVYRIEPFLSYQADGYSTMSQRIEPARIWDDRVNVRLREPEGVPVVSLICPFPVLERLRNDGVCSNGGASPPFLANIKPERVERGEMDIAELLLNVSRANPAQAKHIIDQLRGDAAFHRSGPLAVWHPSEVIPYPDAPVIRAETYDDAVTALNALDRADTACARRE